MTGGWRDGHAQAVQWLVGIGRERCDAGTVSVGYWFTVARPMPLARSKSRSVKNKAKYQIGLAC